MASYMGSFRIKRNMKWKQGLCVGLYPSSLGWGFRWCGGEGRRGRGRWEKRLGFRGLGV